MINVGVSLSKSTDKRRQGRNVPESQQDKYRHLYKVRRANGDVVSKVSGWIDLISLTYQANSNNPKFCNFWFSGCLNLSSITAAVFNDTHHQIKLDS